MRRALALLLLAAVAGGAATSALAAQSPQALRTAIFVAARERHSLHYVMAELQGGKRVRIVGDVAATSGTQQLTLAGKTTGHVTVSVLGRTAYLRGDRAGLRAMGLPAAASSQYARTWISVPRTSKLFAPLADAVTLPSFLGDIFPVTNLAFVHRSGRVGLRGKALLDGALVDVTLFANPSGPPLPLEEDQDGKAFRSHVAISRWNEPVHVTAPKHAVPIAVVLGGGGPVA